MDVNKNYRYFNTEEIQVMQLLTGGTTGKEQARTSANEKGETGVTTGINVSEFAAQHFFAICSANPSIDGWQNNKADLTLELEDAISLSAVGQKMKS